MVNNNDVLTFQERDYSFQPFKDSRQLPGQSGQLLIATHKSNESRMIIKNTFEADVANEFFANNYGILLGLDLPHAYIGTIRKQPAVGIEFINGFCRFDYHELSQELIKKNIELIAFNAVIVNEDKIQISAVRNSDGAIERVVSYDLAVSFGWDSNYFRAALQSSPNMRRIIPFGISKITHYQRNGYVALPPK